MVDLDITVIESLSKEEKSPMDPVSEAEVVSARKRLNNNKAVDIMGLTSGHSKLAGHEFAEFRFLNYMINTKTVSIILKEGILTPPFK